MGTPQALYLENLKIGEPTPMAPYSNWVPPDPRRPFYVKLWDFIRDGGGDPFGTVLESEEFTGVAEVAAEGSSTGSVPPVNAPRILVHFVRHGQSVCDDPYSKMDKELRENYLDPHLSCVGQAQVANLCRTFPRMHLITTVLSSTSRRALKTTSLGFRPLILKKLPVIMVPQLREFGRHPNKPFNVCYPRNALHRDCPELKELLDWKYCFEINKHPTTDKKFGYTTSDTRGVSKDYATGLDELKKLIYNEGMTAIEKGNLNKEGNVEILVVGHAEKLGCLIGLLRAEERNRQPWIHTQYRTFQFVPGLFAEAEGKEPWETLEEVKVEGNGKSHMEQHYWMNKKEFRFLGWDWPEICKAETGFKFQVQRQKADKAEAAYRKKHPRKDYTNPANSQFLIQREKEYKEKELAKSVKKMEKRKKKIEAFRKKYKGRLPVANVTERTKALNKRTVPKRQKIQRKDPMLVEAMPVIIEVESTMGDTLEERKTDMTDLPLLTSQLSLSDA